MSAAPALLLRDLRVAYGAMPAVRGVDMIVGPGEAVAVVGSNGAGKTSLLRGVMGLVAASAAALEFKGRSIRGVATHVISQLGVGYVPEGRELFPGFRVEEELLIGGRLLAPRDRAARMEEMYALFPRIAERRTQIVRTLSGGEQQMLALARALMKGPQLLLLDEPSLGLAPVIQDVVYAALAQLKAAGLSMLLVEQNAYRALKLCDRAYVLELGTITREGAARDLLGDPAIRTAYLGG